MNAIVGLFPSFRLRHKYCTLNKVLKNQCEQARRETRMFDCSTRDMTLYECMRITIYMLKVCLLNALYNVYMYIHPAK